MTKVQVGDVVKIPLGNGRDAYARVLRDASIAVYRDLGQIEAKISDGAGYLFVVGVYRDVLTSGRWPVVGHIDFPTEDEEWPPPHSVHDVMTGRRKIYERGLIRVANATDPQDLESAAVWDADGIIQRVLSLTGQSAWRES